METPTKTTNPGRTGGVTINHPCNMKKVSYLLAAVAVLALAGCAKEIEKQGAENAGDAVSLRVSVEEPESRVSIDNAAAFSFQSGDIISVITSEGTPVDFTTVAGGTSVDFTGTLPTGESVGDYALYPASSNHMVDGDEVLFTLEEELTWNADESFMPMLAKIDNGTASFKAVGGVLKLIVYNIPAAADYLYFSSNNQQISGEFEIADASVASPVIATGVASGSNDGLIIDFSADYSTNKVFYIPLPTGTINGFSIAFWDDNMDDISGATKTTSATLNVTRNKIIIAPALNMAPATNVTLWSEDFTTELVNNPNQNSTVTFAEYNDEKLGQYVISGVVDYSTASTNSLLYPAGTAAKGAEAGELFLKAHGKFVVTGIPTSGASNASLSFVSNKNNTEFYSVSSSTQGITVGNAIISGTATPYIVTYPISIGSSVQTFSLTFDNTNANTNCRIDDIVLSATVGTAAITPSISTGSNSETIAAGALSASISNVALVNPLDNLGISAVTTADWLSLSLTDNGTTLQATANSYYHGPNDYREANVTLKATGATKTVSFKQYASVIHNPSSLAAIPGDKTFEVSWTGDNKVATYEAYYSASDLTNGDPAVSGTSLSISNNGTAYSAEPTADLVNGTTYYVYVRAASLGSEYVDKYIISEGWASTTVTPQAPSVGTVIDHLTYSLIGVTGTSYSDWSNKTSNSDAVYAGNTSGGGNSNCISIRSNNSNSGIITTASGGKLKKITITFNSGVASGRTVQIYGKNSAYSNATDLYSASTQGTLLGTIVEGTSTELIINGNYAFFGLKSSNNAILMDDIAIEWDVTGSGSGSGSGSATFTFNTDAGLSALGITKPNSSSSTDLTGPYTLDGVTMTVSHGSTNTRVWNSNGTLDLRVYKDGGALAFSVASGKSIKSISLTGSATGNFTANVGSFSSGTWAGSSNSVTLSATNTGKINTIAVTYE